MIVKSPSFTITSDNTLKMGDFGILSSTYWENDITNTDVVKWLAPEVSIKNWQVSGEASVFGFGVVLSELLTCREPYEGMSPAEVREKVKTGLRPKIPDGCPQRYAALIQQCLNGDPCERPDIRNVIMNLASINSIEDDENDSSKTSGSNRQSVTDRDNCSENSEEDVSEDSSRTDDKYQIMDENGGEIVNQGFKLKVHDGSLPKGCNVKISISTAKNVPLPPILEEQVVLTPLVSCKPNNQIFQKPVTLSVPHSGTNISPTFVEVWCKSDTASLWLKNIQRREPRFQYTAWDFRDG